MNTISNLDGGVIYAVFGLLAVSIGAIVWAMKWFATSFSKDIKEHTKAAQKQVVSNDKLVSATLANTEASEQMIAFMKNLNGKLAKATNDTIKEANK